MNASSLLGLWKYRTPVIIWVRVCIIYSVRLTVALYQKIMDGDAIAKKMIATSKLLMVQFYWSLALTHSLMQSNQMLHLLYAYVRFVM